MKPEFQPIEELLLYLDKKELELVKTAIEMLYIRLRLEISISFNQEESADQLMTLLKLLRRLE